MFFFITICKIHECSSELTKTENFMTIYDKLFIITSFYTCLLYVMFHYRLPTANKAGRFDILLAYCSENDAWLIIMTHCISSPRAKTYVLYFHNILKQTHRLFNEILKVKYFSNNFVLFISFSKNMKHETQLLFNINIR